MEVWTGSHHDLAMQPATAETVLGDFGDVTYTHFDVTSRFSERDGKYFVRTDGPEGELAEFEVAYVFGVTPLQQYLVEFSGGRMQTLPLAWDSRPEAEGGGRWFHLYPDDPMPAGDPLHWTGLFQNWNHMCADCHSTNLEKGYDPQTNTFDTTWSELDVSCEACHGQGSRHVEWAEAYERDEDVADFDDLGLVRRLMDQDEGRWVIDIETGNAERFPARTSHAELETCAPCHSRRSAIAPRAPGDKFLDAYRPALLEELLYFPDGQIQDEVYVYGSFLQSKMYGKGVTCNDCHEPHELGVRFEGNSLCGQCHYTEKYDTPEHHHHLQGSVGALCVECHMPTRTYMVVDDRHDHSLRIPRPDLSVKLGTPNACDACHADKGAQWSADAVVEWYGAERPAHYGEALHAGRGGLPGADLLLAQLVVDEEAPGIARATAVVALGDYLTQQLLEVVESGLTDADPLVRTAALHGLEALAPAGRLQRAFPLLEDPVRHVRIEAGRILAGAPWQSFPAAHQATLISAFDEYRAAQLMTAELPSSYLNIGLLETDLRRLAAAEAAYRTAIRLDPHFVQAYLNLADLFREQEREDDAELTLREALALAPENGFVHHALGLLFARRKQLEDATAALGEAWMREPGIARFGYVYGICLNDVGETELALSVLKDAYVRHPTDREILGALASMHADAGLNMEALRYAELLSTLAPGDAGVRQLIERLRPK